MITITVSNERQREVVTHEVGPIELGRAPSTDHASVVVEDSYVSRRQLTLEATAARRVQVNNLGGPIKLSDDSVMESGDEREIEVPFSIGAGYTTIEVVAAEPQEDSSLQTIFRPVRPRLQPEKEPEEAKPAALPDKDKTALQQLAEAPSIETLTRWFETLLAVQRSAAGSAGFFEETARAVVELVGLDRGLVLRYQGGTWEVVASAARNEGLATGYSKGVLARVLQEKRTFFQSMDGTSSVGESLAHVESVVASPVFDSEDDVVGIVYGSRDVLSMTQRTGVQPLEAQLVQLLAGAVSAGLARHGQEVANARMRVQFERFASPALVRELERNPRLLQGTDREITVLFADMRGFSGISERLAATDTYRLVSDVMNCLTNRIRNSGGAIIDYYGDGVAAMWNAPTDQEDHARLACQTALEMRDELPGINQRWREVVGAPLDIGIGINTGMAQVGNAGSRWRLKYGPRGHNVNLAARLESGTKFFDVPILISDPTHACVRGKLAMRRLCQLAVKGVTEAVDVFELKGELGDRAWESDRDSYERALGLFERQQLEQARAELETLVERRGGDPDKACGLLLERITAAEQGGAAFDPVLRLDQK